MKIKMNFTLNFLKNPFESAAKGKGCGGYTQ